MSQVTQKSKIQNNKKKAKKNNKKTKTKNRKMKQNSKFWADYMRDTFQLLAHLGLKIFFSLFDQKMYPVHKRTEGRLEIVLYCFFKFQRLAFYFPNVYVWIFFDSFSIWPRTVMILLDYQSAYGSLMAHLLQKRITCKKICYMRFSGCRWLIFQNAKKFIRYVKPF